VEKFKSDYYEQHSKDKQKDTQQHYVELKNRELEMVVAEVRGKEVLYQNIIKEKDAVI
jgi:hypothetical protein